MNNSKMVRDIKAMVVTGVIDKGTNLEKKISLSIPVDKESCIQLETSNVEFNNIDENTLYNFTGAILHFDLDIRGTLTKEL